MKSKSHLRRTIIGRRDELLPQEIRRLSAAASSHLFALPEFKSARTVMFFVSFGSEIDTLPMIEKALSEGKTVAAPAADPASRTLTPRELRSLTADLAPGAHDIREPQARCRPVQLPEIDVVIAPAAVWGEDGYRVGYGGGYYDRFLASVPNATRIGLGLEAQVVRVVPHGPQDLPVDLLVTETGARRFRHREVRDDRKSPREGPDGE
jgi:5-formyltetrahydrofolate cyclo-ligase